MTLAQSDTLRAYVEEELERHLRLHDWYAIQHARPFGLRWPDWSHDNRVQIAVLVKMVRRLRG